MATTIANLTAKADGSMEGVFATLRVNAPITLIPNANKTREDALEAWKIVKERNALWAEANRKWRKWGENTPSDGRDDGFDGFDD